MSSGPTLKTDPKRDSNLKRVLSSVITLITSSFVGDKGVSVLEEEALQTPGKTILKNFFRHKLGIFGIMGVIFFLLFSFLGSQLRPIDLTHIETALRNLRPGQNYLRFPRQLVTEGVDQISSGISYSIALSNAGNVYVWGTEPTFVSEGIATSVIRIPPEVTEAVIVHVAAGDRHAIALDSQGRIHGWGFNNHKQTEASPVVLSKLGEGISVVHLFAGEAYSGALFADGELHIWGNTRSNRFDSIPAAYQGRIAKVAPSTHNIALLLDDGTIGVIGIRGNPFSTVPENLLDGSIQLVDLTATYRAVLALDDQGGLHIWGDIEHDLLTIPERRGSVVAMDAGKNNFALLLDTGEVVYWGANHYGQLNLPESLVDDDVVAIYADMFQNYAVHSDSSVTAWGNKGFLFGSDEFGRDVLTRLIHGGRISLTVGAMSVVISVIIALFIGMTAGFFGGWIDMALMRFTDVVVAIPFLPIAITLSAVLSGRVSEMYRIYMIMVVIGVLSWTGLARLIRAQILLEREKDFVLAADALGVKRRHIILRHIMPNIFNLAIVSITLSYARSLLIEAGLSFLGFGVAPPTPSWGNMLQGAQSISVVEYWWWRWLIPGLFVVLAALSVNLVGDALREAMDPKANEK